MIVRVTLTMDEEIANEFKELRQFWYEDEDNHVIRPEITETLRRYIIDCINDYRTEVALCEATENVNKIHEGHITIIDASPVPEPITR